MVPAGHVRCLVCRLERSKMDAVEAELAPQRRKEQARAERGPAWWQSKWTLMVIAVLVVGAVVLALAPGKPGRAPWLDYPLGKEGAVKDFLAAVGTGRDADLADAYKMIAPSAKKAGNRDNEKKYEQIFVEINKYLDGEFGTNWPAEVQVEEAPDDSNLMLAHIGAETLHVRVEMQTPLKVASGSNQHYAIVGVDEFDVNEAGGFQQTEAIMGSLQALGASKGQVEQLGSVIAAGHPRHETRMQTKVRLLPTLRNPRMLSRRVLLETWVVRKDPVIRRRLEMIAGDGRYDQATRDSAKAVLEDNVPEEELIAISVDPDSPG
jgi:hypothetical protein